MTKSIKDKVIELEKRNRLIMENLVDSIWVVDAETYRYEYFAPPLHRISGNTAAELIGKSIFDELTPESSKRAIELLRYERKA